MISKILSYSKIQIVTFHISIVQIGATAYVDISKPFTLYVKFSKIHVMKSFSFKILPVVQQQAEPTQRVQRRIIAAKLVQKLADILPSTEYDQFWKKIEKVL